MIPVLWHYGGRGSWCHTIVEHMTQGYEHHTFYQKAPVPAFDSIVVVIKADQLPGSVGDYTHLNAQLNLFRRVVLIVTANEEGRFDTSRIIHPRIKIWLQTPHAHQTFHRAIPWGWTPHVKPSIGPRPLNWSFAGQNTHERRRECLDVLRAIRAKKQDGLLYESSTFAGGLNQPTYAQLLSSSRLIPCPSGPITVDSFRVCEAMECGAIPIVDTVSPRGPYGDYWYRVFGEHLPFPLIFDWKTLPDVMDEWLDNWQERADTVQKWWASKKTEWVRQLAEDDNE